MLPLFLLVISLFPFHKETLCIENETVWLSQAQMTELFQKDQSVIARHIKNIFIEKELETESNMQILHNTISKFRPTARDINVHFLHVKGVKKR